MTMRRVASITSTKRIVLTRRAASLAIFAYNLQNPLLRTADFDGKPPLVPLS